jgi:enoyl-CoA hydratase/carnithine racemase
MRENSLVIYEVKDHIAYISLNRPQSLNALNSEMSIELGKTWKRFESDAEARVAVFQGIGRAFCVGQDFNVDISSAKPEDVDKQVADLRKAFPSNGIRVLKPIVGAIQGFALGAGFSLAIHGCDITIAAAGTKFGFPEAKVGVVGGIVEYLPYMPFKISLELLMTAKFMSAERAYEIGMVNKVVALPDLLGEAVKIADVLKKNAPLTIRAIKYAQYKIVDNKMAKLRREAAKEFDEYIKPQFYSEDIKEGAIAFMEKREPRFRGL